MTTKTETTILDISDSDRLWDALKTIAKGNLEYHCAVAIEGGATREQLDALIDDLLPRSATWMRDSFYLIRAAIESDGKTKH